MEDERTVGPVRYRVDVDSGVLWVAAAGELTVDHVVAFITEMTVIPEWRAGMNELFDLRAVTRFAIDPEQMRTVLFTGKMSFEPAASRRRALVADDDLAFGMLRMYASLSEARTVTIDVFRDIAVARDWVLECPVAADRS